MAAARKPQRDKISAEFAARLDQSPPDQALRSIVLLETETAGGGGREPPSRERRRAAVTAVKQSAQLALKTVDEVLERIGGRRLSAAPDALGSVRVEVTPEGIYRLAHLKEVKALLEDQGLFPLPPAKT
jgi:hypothetical protein